MSSTRRRASKISLRLEWVDRTPWRVRIIWPFSVAVDGGRCFVINSMVKPGKDQSWLFLMAFIMVDAGGEHSI